MYAERRQHGASILAIAFVLVVLSFAGYVGLKLLPVYSESFRIDSSLESLVQNEDLRNMPNRDIVDALVRRLEVNEVSFINRRTHPNYVDIAKRTDKVVIRLSYRREVPLFGNLTLLADFEKRVEQ